MRIRVQPVAILAFLILATSAQAQVSDVTLKCQKIIVKAVEKFVDKVADPIRQFLQRQRDHSIRGLFIEALKRRSNVKIALEPPRVDVQIAQNDPAKGPASAPVTIVEYVDFQ